LWHEPASTWSQNAPLGAPSALQDAPHLDWADPALPEAEPDAIARLYLPAIVVEAPAVDPQAAAETPTAPRSVASRPESPTPAAPLQLPDPRLDVPRSTVRARAARPSTPAPADKSQGSAASSFDDSPAASADGTSSLLAADLDGLALPSQTAAADPVPADLVSADQTARWIWPVHGEISQFFSDSHRGIDIVSEQGEVVVAADGGEVIYAKWESSGLGYLVVVDHGDGYRTYYAHLYGFYAGVGQVIERGDLVGQLGNTGNSTGPHVHFEIRYLGVSRDPLKLLPPG